MILHLLNDLSQLYSELILTLSEIFQLIVLLSLVYLSCTTICFYYFGAM